MADEDDNDIEDTMSEFRSRYQEGEADEEEEADSSAPAPQEDSTEEDPEISEEDASGEPEDPSGRDGDDDVTSSVVGKRLGGPPEGESGTEAGRLDRMDDSQDAGEPNEEGFDFTPGIDRPDETNPTEEAVPPEAGEPVSGEEDDEEAGISSNVKSDEVESSAPESPAEEGETSIGEDDEESGASPVVDADVDAPSGGVVGERPDADDRRESDRPETAEAHPEEGKDEGSEGPVPTGRPGSPREGAETAGMDVEPGPSAEDRSDESPLETSSSSANVEDSVPDPPEAPGEETSYPTRPDEEEPDAGGSAGGGMGSKVSRILARILVIGAILAFFWFVGGRGEASDDGRDAQEDPGESRDDRKR